MRKLLTTILALSSSLVFGAPVWTEYMFKVNNPDSAAKIIAAADAFMASDVRPACRYAAAKLPCASYAVVLCWMQNS